MSLVGKGLVETMICDVKNKFLVANLWAVSVSCSIVAVDDITHQDLKLKPVKFTLGGWAQRQKVVHVWR